MVFVKKIYLSCSSAAFLAFIFVNLFCINQMPPHPPPIQTHCYYYPPLPASIFIELSAYHLYLSILWQQGVPKNMKQSDLFTYNKINKPDFKDLQRIDKPRSIFSFLFCLTFRIKRRISIFLLFGTPCI